MDSKTLTEVKAHYEAFGSLPLETMNVLFELAEKQATDKAEVPVIKQPAPERRTTKATKA